MKLTKNVLGPKYPLGGGTGSEIFKKKLIMIPTMPLHVPMLRKKIKSYFEKMTTGVNPSH